MGADKLQPYLAQVVRSHRTKFSRPIQLHQGDTVTIQPREDEDPGWVWTVTSTGNAGWTPRAYLELNDDQARVCRDYDATELNVDPGDQLNVLVIESGWVWGQNTEGKFGWVPLAVLEIPEIPKAGRDLD